MKTFISFITRQLVAGCLLIPLLMGCNQEPPPPAKTTSSATPRDGIGQRRGIEVTGQPSLTHTPGPAEGQRIVAFGNSLTAGLGVGSDEAYPAELQRRLDQDGYRYRVVNAGVSGETTAGGLRRVSWILQSKPDLVILELGGNDGLRGLSLEETKTNLEQIIRRFREAQVTVLLAGMKLPPNYGADYRAGFETIYKALAKQYRLPLIPFFLDGVAGSATLNQADGIHPTAEGYRIIVDRMFPALTVILDKQENLKGKRAMRTTVPRTQ